MNKTHSINFGVPQAPGEDCHAIRRALERMLNERFKIAHTTLQVDHAHQQVLSIQRNGERPSST